MVFLKTFVTFVIPASFCILFILRPRVITKMIRLSSMRTEKELKFIDRMVQVTGMFGLCFFVYSLVYSLGLIVGLWR